MQWVRVRVRARVRVSLSVSVRVSVSSAFSEAFCRNSGLYRFVVANMASGVAVMNNVVYVVRSKCSIIRTYTADTSSPVGEGILVEGLTDPKDIVACHRDGQLYVLCTSKCIWRVSTEDRSQYEHWPTDVTGDIWGMTLTSQRLLVTSMWLCRLHQYSTTDGQLLRVVQLSQIVKSLFHGVETARETFIVTHRGTVRSEWHNAVSQVILLYLFSLL